jgi:hypothetical protein
VDSDLLRGAIAKYGVAEAARLAHVTQHITQIIRDDMLNNLQLPSGNWKTYPLFGKMYAFSSNGEVLSSRYGAWNIPKLSIVGGYRAIGYLIEVNGEKKLCFVKISRIILELFGGKKPKNKDWVLHWNDNKKDDRSENLYWGTPKDNALDTVRNHGNKSRISVEKAQEIYKCKGTISEIASRFGVSYQIVVNIQNGITFSAFTKSLIRGRK